MPSLQDYKPGSIVTIPGFLFQYTWSGSPSFATCEVTGKDIVTIGPYELSFVVPDDFNPTLKEIESIDQQIAHARVTCAVEVAGLQKRKENLLQLSCNKPLVLGPEDDDAPALQTINQMEADAGSEDDDIPF